MAETLLDNLHNDQAETKSILENTPKEDSAAQPVEPEQSTEYTLDELQGDLAAKRGVQDVVNPTTEYLSPDTESTEDEKVRAAAANSAEPEYAPVLNYLTGEYTDDNTSSRDRDRLTRANRAAEKLIQLYDIYGNPTDEQIEAAIKGDEFAFNDVYNHDNRHAANAGSLFGGSFGFVPQSTRDAVARIIQANNARKEKEEADAAAEAERKANETVKVDGLAEGSTYDVTKQFSDDFKFLASEYSTAETDERKKQVLSALYQKMVDAGYGDLLPKLTPETMPTDINELLHKAPSLEAERVLNSIFTEASKDRSVKPQQKSLDDRLRERAELKELVDARNQAREIQRAKSRTGMVGIAALIGDMIRASEGAPVSQRDYQRIYDNLDAQARANINNYNIRMQKIKDDANRARMAQQAAAAKAAKEEADRNLQLTLEAGRNKRWADKLDNDLLIAQIRAGLAAGKSSGKGGTPPDTLPIRVDGKDYYFRTGRYKAIMRNIAGVLNRANVVFNIKNKLTGEISDTSLAEAVARYLLGGDQTAVGATGPTWAQLPRQEKEEILSILRGSDYTGSSEIDEPEEHEPTTTTTTTQTEPAVAEPVVPEFE